MVGNTRRCGSGPLKKAAAVSFPPSKGCIWKDGSWSVPALLFIQDILMFSQIYAVHFLNEVESTCKQVLAGDEMEMVYFEKLVEKENDLHIANMFHPDK